MEDLRGKFGKETDGFTWQDVWFNQLNKFANTRNTGDLISYITSVETMQILLAGVIDGHFEEEKFKLDLDFKKLETIEEKPYYDGLSAELVKLLTRSTAGKVDLSQHVESSSIIKNIASNLRKGIGQNMMITGRMGSGKSWASLKIGQEVVKLSGGLFTHEHVVSNLEAFMTLYNDKEKCPPGSVIIFEEVGVNLNSKKAMTKLNILFADIFQTSRYRELLILMNAPALSFLDKTPRSLLHWWIQTDRLNKSKGICEVKPHIVELDQIRGELLFPYPRLRDGQRITRIDVSVPTKDLTDKYEKSSRAYKDQVGKDSMNVMKNKGFNKLECDYIKLRQEGHTQKSALELLGKSQTWATRIENQARERDVLLPEMRGLAKKEPLQATSP